MILQIKMHKILQMSFIFVLTTVNDDEMTAAVAFCSSASVSRKTLSFHVLLILFRSDRYLL